MAEAVSSQSDDAVSPLPDAAEAFEAHTPFLPVPLTPLVGREREVADVTALLRQPAVRLVTLVGPGGIGKTRLALAVADGLRGDFPAGVDFVDLTSLVDPELVPLTIARQLDLAEATDRPPLDRLIQALAHQRRLLVLDNWERLVSATPHLARLLSACPGLKVLATSRVALGIRGERQVEPPPLAVPERRPDGRLVVPPPDELARIASVALFIDRARAIDPAFALTAGNAEAVAEICHRLEGLPLAIELAAAWCRFLTPEEIRDRLAAPLDLLTRGPRDLPDRQRTLRATIAWSHDLLPSPIQAFFRRLAVFSDGFSLEGAEAVGAGSEAAGGGEAGDERSPALSRLPPATPPTFDSVAVLVEHSLVRPLVGPTPRGYPDARFGMLETIREYAGELLAESGEERAVRAAHAAYFRSLAARAFPHLRSTDQVTWLDRLDAEHANLRAALRWAEEHDPPTVAALAQPLWLFWWLRGHLTEGRDWAGRALAVEGVAPATRAKVLHGAGMLAHEQGDLPAAEAHYHEALATALAADEPLVAAASLGNLGTLAMLRGDLTAAEAFHEECLAIERAAGHRQGLTHTLGNLGVLAWERGDPARAAELWQECLELAQEFGDLESVALTWINLGDAAATQGDPATAERHYDAALDLLRQLGNRHDIAIALNGLADVVRERGDTPRAATLLRECIDLVRELGGAQRLAAYLEAVARLALTAFPTDSARLYGAATALREANAMAASRTEAAHRERDLAALRQRLDPDAFDAAWAAGQALTAAAAIDEALAITENPSLTSPTAVPGEAPALEAVAPYGLTDREVEVLRLLVQGRTEPEIADALFLSQGIVFNHVVAILAKLAVPSRTAAASKAIRDGLI